MKPHPTPQSRAFSLLELLVVLAIMVAVVALAAPVTSGIMRGNQLTGSSQSLINQLSLARQSALTNGNAVQVRLYKLPDYSKPSGSPSVYRAIQCFTEGEPQMVGGTATAPLKPMTAPLLFPAPVVIYDGTTESSLLRLPTVTPSVLDAGVGTYGTNYQYIAFRFRADGQVDIPENATGLTLVLQNDATASGSLPANFCSIEIDPRTGGIRSFRP